MQEIKSVTAGRHFRYVVYLAEMVRLFRTGHFGGIGSIPNHNVALNSHAKFLGMLFILAKLPVYAERVFSAG